ncbi:MAG: alpha/beta fold hydrolase [Bradymonadaceae bacterium]
MLYSDEVFEPDGQSIRSVYRESSFGDEPFHWLEAGAENDRTLVLVHGILAHSMAYRKVIAPLAERFHLVLPDLPGHGRDETFRSRRIRPEIYDLVDWFEQLLQTVAGSEPVSVAGHSLGALVGFIAARERDRFHPIDRLALISPGIRIGIPRWTAEFFEALPTSIAEWAANEVGLRAYEPIQWRQSRMSGEELDSYLEPLQDADRLEFIKELGADLLREPDRLPGAHRVTIPTLLITGDRDHLVSVDTARLLNSVIPDSRIEILEDVGHCPMEDAPGPFSDFLLDFFGGED